MSTPLFGTLHWKAFEVEVGIRAQAFFFWPMVRRMQHILHSWDVTSDTFVRQAFVARRVAPGNVETRIEPLSNVFLGGNLGKEMLQNVAQ